MRCRTVPADRTSPAPEPYDFGRTATDVEEQYAFGFVVGQSRAPLGRQTGFGLAVDDLDVEARSLPDAVEKGGAVFGGPTGLRRDQARAGDTAGRHLVVADFKRREGPLDGPVAEPPGRHEIFAEPDDAREGIHDPEPVLARSRDQQAAIVGAEVEGRVDVPLRTTLA